jgi:hypothetical protein
VLHNHLLSHRVRAAIHHLPAVHPPLLRHQMLLQAVQEERSKKAGDGRQPRLQHGNRPEHIRPDRAAPVQQEEVRTQAHLLHILHQPIPIRLFQSLDGSEQAACL